MSAIKEIERLFDSLDRKDQLLVLERLARRMRLAERGAEGTEGQPIDLVPEPGHDAPYPIPEGVYSEDQLVPRGKSRSAPNSVTR